MKRETPKAIKQKTIAREASLKGVGLHTGKEAVVRILPAPVNSGINFIRVDLPERPVISANISNVIDITRRPRRTSIGIDGFEVHTIEHLMSALCALDITNVNIEISDEEVPGLDGSALPFMEALEEAGVHDQDELAQFYQVREPIWIEEGGASVIVLPDDNFKVSYTLSYKHLGLSDQYASFILNKDIYKQEIAPARTFCLEDEADLLRKQGLGKGADYKNTLVVGPKGVIDNTVRLDDEFVRHKISDLIGDFYLLGYPIKAHVIAIKSGHSLNIKLLERIRRQQYRLHAGGIKGAYIGELSGRQIDVEAIQRILPHRYPFLLVDRIIEIEEDKRAVGIKNVTINDQFFTGHFPGHPVMPGVLILEALAQVAGVLMLSKSENAGKLAYFLSLDNAKFRKTVVPGDQLFLEVEVTKLKSKTGQAHAQGIVDGKVVAEADLMFSLVEP